VTPPPPRSRTIRRRARERLARKENKAFSKALLRHAGEPDSMRDWIKAFYGGHVSCVMETLDLRKNEAKVYCDFQKKEALEANDWPILLERREAELAGTIRSRVDPQAG
jgi:hypothetical protein